MPVGGDFPLYYFEDGNTFADLDIDMVLITDENEKIYCKATGVFNYVTETFESIKFPEIGIHPFSPASLAVIEFGFFNETAISGCGV